MLDSTVKKAFFAPKPEPLPPGNCFRRFLTAKVLASVYRRSSGEVAATMWPRDKLIGEIIERAASAPAMTTVPGWAQELAQIFVTDAIQVMSGVSSATRVMREGLVLAFDGHGTILVPGLAVDATAAGFVAEGAPIPVHNLGLTPASMQPNQLASIAVLTREMIESSNAEALVSDALMKAAGLALDAAFFGTGAASAAQPAGLRNGVTALTPSSATDIFEAYYEDISTLVGAVAPVAGNGQTPFFLVGSPQRSFVLQMRFIRGGETPSESANTIFGSSAMGNDLMAIAQNAIASVIGTDPIIETSNAATLHMDTAPQPVGSVGPERSVWQTDSIAVKMRWVVSWALRDPRGVAWMTPTWK
jgi:hypothetical protein